MLDEPTSGLDVLVRREFLESMVDLAGAGRTVLLSSHQMAEVERVASHIALMHRQGRLILAEPLDAAQGTDVPGIAHVHRPRPSRGDSPAGMPIPKLIDLDDAPRQARWIVHAASMSAEEPLRPDEV